MTLMDSPYQGMSMKKTAKIAADESLFNYKTNFRFFEGVLDLPM